MAPPYDQLSLAEVWGSAESVEGPPAKPKTVTKANMGPPTPKIRHGLKLAIKPMTYGRFSMSPDAESGKKSHGISSFLRDHPDTGMAFNRLNLISSSAKKGATSPSSYIQRCVLVTI